MAVAQGKGVGPRDWAPHVETYVNTEQLPRGTHYLEHKDLQVQANQPFFTSFGKPSPSFDSCSSGHQRCPVAPAEGGDCGHGQRAAGREQ